MKLLRRFLNTVPKTVQLWASVLVGCALLVGLVVGSKTPDQGAVLRTMSAYGSAALVLGIVLAIWLLCLGFVFADARRRDMRSVLWVLVAALFPHLLGFLLYFVMRHPIAATCTHCGMTVSNYQRFCSWCGTAQFPLNSTKGPLTANPSQGVGQ
jgi:Phospholipase_D-nuclease N-terminal/zinc-ribbon domain